MAAGSDGMGGADTFYEIDIRRPRAQQELPWIPLYGYGAFGGAGALAAASSAPRTAATSCARCTTTAPVTRGGTDVQRRSRWTPGRVWEAQGVGTAPPRRRSRADYPQCADPGHDMRCVRRLAPVRGQRARSALPRPLPHGNHRGQHPYLRQWLPVYADRRAVRSNPHTGADNRIPDSWFNGVGRILHVVDQLCAVHHPTRWHWDRLAVNPHQSNGTFLSQSASPSILPGLDTQHVS